MPSKERNHILFLALKAFLNISHKIFSLFLRVEFIAQFLRECRFNRFPITILNLMFSFVDVVEVRFFSVWSVQLLLMDSIHSDLYSNMEPGRR